ncbi:potassium voltage-gated channel protein Shaw-like [Mya arenaria]|uniref:potassium voltage-gated channel protein Shaw-like n=1 Tax=Mya arenaria TaxID=6604 RepID=UPI0022DF5F9E|nr:potassium voltage-gated channel protein Shaw-like [Mya arenaria]
MPESKLARLTEDDLELETGTDRSEYFFDRNPVFFNIILDAYRKGFVHLPKDICGLDFKKELDFWEISPGHVAPCCWEAYYRGQSEEDTMTRLMDNYKNNTNVCLMLGQRESFKERLWLFLDEPHSSRHAFVG